MSRPSVKEWDLVGIAVNIIVAVLLIGGLITYAAAGPASLTSAPSGFTPNAATLEDVDKRSDDIDPPRFDDREHDEADDRDDDDFDDDDLDEDDRDEDREDDDKKGQGNGHGHGNGKGNGN